MHDVLDIIRNVQSLYSVGPTLGILKDFERVVDELDVYVFENWPEGELLTGPVDSRHFVTCSFMWPADKMPDPAGGKRLLDKGCKVSYKKDELLKPREIKSPEDYRPGTTKGKIDSHDIWIVEIKMPKQLIGNMKHGRDEIETQDSTGEPSLDLDDKNILVLSLIVDGQAPARDLERFAEVGYKSVLDADATPGTLEDGKHRVFVEFARTPEVVSQIIAFLEDLKKLTNIEEFEYTYHKSENPTVVSASTMGEAIPTTPEAYEQRVNEMRVSEARHFFDKYDMMECKINENTISVKKTGAGHELKFELHKFGTTNDVMKETKAFKIDMDSIAECTYLTKYFGPYNITKTNENKFIFSKNGESALLSRI